MTDVAAALDEFDRAYQRLRAALLGSASASVPKVAKLLTPQDYQEAAERLRVPLATVYAVDEVESGRDGGFDSLGRCTILYEPHVFSRETEHRFDATQGGVSNPKWKGVPYPTGSEDERNAANWAKLEYAAKLPGAEVAAYRSASYGRFQVMGFNHQICGFATVAEFVSAMQRSERDHLMAFIAYVEKRNLGRYLQAGNWEAFAAGYNGTGQAKAYGAKIAAAVRKHGG